MSIYVECDICGEAYGPESTGYLTETWIHNGHECVTHCKDCDPHEEAFTLEDAGPAHDTPRKRGVRTIYVDGPNGKGDACSGIEISGPDRDAIASLLLSMFGAEEKKPFTKAERLERYKRDILAAQAEREARRGQPASLKGADNG